MLHEMSASCCRWGVHRASWDMRVLHRLFGVHVYAVYASCTLQQQELWTAHVSRLRLQYAVAGVLCFMVCCCEPSVRCSKLHAAHSSPTSHTAHSARHAQHTARQAQHMCHGAHPPDLVSLSPVCVFGTRLRGGWSERLCPSRCCASLVSQWTVQLPHPAHMCICHQSITVWEHNGTTPAV